jgi:hypothetical protein
MREVFDLEPAGGLHVYVLSGRVDYPVNASAGVHDFLYMDYNAVQNLTRFFPLVDGCSDLPESFEKSRLLNGSINGDGALPCNTVIKFTVAFIERYGLAEINPRAPLAEFLLPAGACR